MDTYAVTRQGLKRKENQDRFFIRPFADQSLLMAVADGMGGEAGGGQAAQTAISVFESFTPGLPTVEDYFINLFQVASQRITEVVQKNPELKGMGTTLTAAYIENGLAHFAHVGDSRLYLFHAGHLTQITEDQTFVNSLLKDGAITAAEAGIHPMKNILLQCVGCGPLEITTGKFRVGPGDGVFLSTDGLHQEIDQDRMVSILTQEISLQKTLESLIQAALEAGGRDDITVVGLRI